MASRTRTQQIIDAGLGQHLALAVAAHLARSQLVPDPLRVYDGQHMSEMVDVVANALLRVAPVYVADAKTASPRQLMEGELEGARVKHGATALVLKNGRILSGTSIKRADLRQAIAILKAVGIPELAGTPKEAAPPPGPPTGDPLARLAEIESLLHSPLVASQVDRANSAIVAIARGATQGRIANLAMQLMSALHEARGGEAVSPEVRMILERLRAALDEEHASPKR